ncbi:hypothetical protein AWC04_00030 [Mycolicibacterium fallax]|uniref:Uncharacterized protein n=1 Tax=Mycolicibacterium fallax TaxID=1793 RepID=A0A1X1RPC0_MYCFA|nr:hypothetical protein AWC04_00030 [Mycolicibacterium fallax]BBY99509.1 trypsin [Mycolicibacterium fallax]
MPVNHLRRFAVGRLSAALLAPLLVLGALLVTPATAGADPAAPMDPNALAAAVEPGLVQIDTLNNFQGLVGNGTGIVLSPEGVVLTNHHVVQGANAIRATSAATGQVFDADVIGYSRANDLAVLQLRGAGGLPMAPLGSSASLVLGEPVLTIGNANGTGHPLTREVGQITSLDRAVDVEDETTHTSHRMGGLIESSTNLRAGDSGGALVNSAGQIVGMNAAATITYRIGGGADPAGQGFAIPIDRALGIASQIRAAESSPYVHIGPSAMLGIGIDAGGPPRPNGLPIRSIMRDGPAERAGIVPGDVLTAIDGTPIDSANTLTGLLDQRHGGDVITLNWVDRTGAARTADVTVISGPVS